jgi:hypothetical protein
MIAYAKELQLIIRIWYRIMELLLQI